MSRDEGPFEFAHGFDDPRTAEDAWIRIAAENARDANEREASIAAQRDELLAALMHYGEHKRGCASKWRAETGSSQIGPCDCGLGAAIAKAASK